MKTVFTKISAISATNYFIYIFNAFCFVIGYNKYFFADNILGNESIFNFVLLAGCIALFKFAFPLTTKRAGMYCAFFSFFLSLIMIIGRSIYLYSSFDGLLYPAKNVLFNVVSVIGFTSVFFAVFILAVHYLTKIEPMLRSSLWKIYRHPIVLGIIIFTAWIPCYLSYYPGIFSYDIDVQTSQALGNTAFTRYHPPLHTFFWKICLSLEQNIGINALVFYSISQMLLLAAALTYVLYFLIKHNFNNWIILFTFLFFCLHPGIAIFSFVPTKDAMFAIVFVVFSVELCFFLSSKNNYAQKPLCSIRLIVFGLLCCLFRNNMVYALIPAIIVMLFLMRKYWKTLLLWGVSIMVSYSLITGPLYSILGVGKGNVREMLSVPIQQLSHVVTHYSESIPDDTLAAINDYIPVEDIPTLYNPRLADPVKITFKTENFERDATVFFKTWFDLLLKYPDEYIVSFLNLNLPYWYPDACTIDAYSNRAYIETNIYPASVTGYEVIRDSKIPWLYAIYEKFASYQAFMTLPIVSNIFSISTPIWVIVISMLLLTIRKKAFLTVPMIPAFFLWCTFMIGPVSNFRYMFPIIVLYPLYLALVLQSECFSKTNS